MNYAASPFIPQPFSLAGHGLSASLWVASGGGVGQYTGVHNASLAIGVKNNGARFLRGLEFEATSITGTDGTGTGSAEAIGMARGHQIAWYNSDASVRSKIDSDFISLGASAPPSGVNLYLVSTADYQPQAALRSINTAGGGVFFLFDRSLDGSADVVNATVLGTLQFRGFANGDYRTGSYLTAVVDGSPSGSNVPTALLFYTSTVSGITDRLRINGLGSVIVGYGGSTSTTATDGFLYVTTSAGAPTGVPSSQTNTVPLRYDTTNHRLYIYDGSWRFVAF